MPRASALGLLYLKFVEVFSRFPKATLSGHKTNDALQVVFSTHLRYFPALTRPASRQCYPCRVGRCSGCTSRGRCHISNALSVVQSVSQRIDYSAQRQVHSCLPECKGSWCWRRRLTLYSLRTGSQ